MICVDSMTSCVPNRRWKWRTSCHLTVTPDGADPIEELHQFAASIGLKRAWFQNHAALPHYDLTEWKRMFAVRQGAVEISREHLVGLMRQWRELKREGLAHA